LWTKLPKNVCFVNAPNQAKKSKADERKKLHEKKISRLQNSEKSQGPHFCSLAGNKNKQKKLESVTQATFLQLGEWFRKQVFQKVFQKVSTQSAVDQFRAKVCRPKCSDTAQASMKTSELRRAARFSQNFVYPKTWPDIAKNMLTYAEGL